MCDKRQDGLTVNSRIDTRVVCPAEIHVHLRLLSNQRFWVVTKFVDSHSHELSSPNEVHHFYSHQTHRSKISRSIMSNLIDVGIHPLFHHTATRVAVSYYANLVEHKTL